MEQRSNLLAAAIIIFSTHYLYSSGDCLSGQNSRYVKGMIEKRYPESEVSEPLLLRWDFSRKETYSYKYSVNMDLEDTVGLIGKEHVNNSFLTESGLIKLDVKGDKKASVRAQGRRLVLKSGNQTVEEAIPDEILFQNISQDGNVTKASKESPITFLWTLLLLPNKPLNVGESSDIELEMPFVENNVQTVKKVQVRQKLIKYVMIGSHLCAQLESSISVSQSNLENATKDQSVYQARGVALSFFDVEQNRILQGSAAVLQCGEIRTNVIVNPNEVNRMRSAYKSDSLIEITP